MKQLVTEGTLLGAIGGICGGLLAGWDIDLFRSLAPSDFPLLQPVHVNPPVFAFCLAISIFSGLVASLIPAYFASRPDIMKALRGRAQTTVGLAHRSYRNALVIAELALSFVLLFGAGLMINSMMRLLRVDPGYRPQNVVKMQMFLSGPRYFEFSPNGVRVYEAVGEFYQTLMEQIETLPGVQSAGLVSWLPDMGYNTGRRERAFEIEEGPHTYHRSPSDASLNAVSAGFFETLKIPLLRGRSFDSRDGTSTPCVAIVNEAFVRRYCSGTDPLGKQIRIDDAWTGPRQIVGVVGNVRQNALDEDAMPEISVPYLQQPIVSSGHGYQNRVHMTLVVRTVSDSRSTVTRVREIAAHLDGSQPVYGIRTMTAVLSDSTSVRRMYTKLLEIVATIALFLSVIGVYGVISHSVAQRVSEIGLRIAVGATRANILSLVLAQGGKLILAGFAVGLAGALMLAHVLRSCVFGITTRDPITMIVCGGVLIGAALGAIWIPASRATRVDPLVALRAEWTML